MSVRCRRSGPRSPKHLRFPQSLYLLFKFGLIDMVLEGLVAVNKHDWDLVAILFFQRSVGFNIDDAEVESEAVLNALDHGFRRITQMAARAGVDINSDGIGTHPNIRKNFLSRRTSKAIWALRSSGDSNFFSSRRR